MLSTCVLAVAISFITYILYFMFSPQATMFDDEMSDVKAIVKHLVKRLNDLNFKNQKLQDEIEKVSLTIPGMNDDVSAELSEVKQVYSTNRGFGLDVKNYDLQLTDFALESAGGRIIDTGNTQTHELYESVLSNHLMKFLKVFCQDCEEARTILQPNTLPGECWAFKGFMGEVVIQLLGKINVTGFALEHIPAVIAPTKEISSAPRHFQVEGLIKRDDKTGYDFGEFEYNIENRPIQYFEVKRASPHFHNYVRVRFNSNWGNPIYTCIYRFRVHGVLAPGQGYINQS